MLTTLQYFLLKCISPQGPAVTEDNRAAVVKLELLGDVFPPLIRNKIVIDFGCGLGAEAIAIAMMGAQRVIGIDIRQDLLNGARARAREMGVESICTFAANTSERADVIVSIDAFEHFADPAAVLSEMDRLLQPDGEAVISFGWTWYHPRGGHLFSVFPWAHLVFSERALIRWRSTIRDDGAKRFHEVEGGLNQMTIDRFEKLVEASPFTIRDLELIPIRKLRFFHNTLTREFMTALVRARLKKRH